MRWYHAVSYFFGGAFLVNALPHFLQGVSGYPFPSPFATPMGEGPSSPSVNVLWGTANFVAAYLLLGQVGTFAFRNWLHMLAAGAGGLAMGLMLARAFGRVHGIQ